MAFGSLWKVTATTAASSSVPQPEVVLLDSKGIFFLPGADLWFPDVLPEVGKCQVGAMGALSLAKAEMARQPQAVSGGLTRSNVRAVAASWLPWTF